MMDCDDTGYLFAFIKSCFVRLYITRKEKGRDGKARALYDTGIFLYSLVFFSYSLFGWLDFLCAGGVGVGAGAPPPKKRALDVSVSVP